MSPSMDNPKTGPRRSARIAQRAIICKSRDSPKLNEPLPISISLNLKNINLSTATDEIFKMDKDLASLSQMTTNLIDENNEMLEVGKDGNNLWNASKEDKFILLMEEEIKKGNRLTTTFSTSGWNNLISGMKSFTNYDYDKCQLKNKYSQLRIAQKDFKRLLQETGVGFDSTTGKVIMDNDRWDKLEKVMPKVKRFKKKGCKNYDRLCVIFDGTNAIGFKARPSTLSPSNSDENPSPKKEVKRERSEEVRVPCCRVKEDSFALTMERVMDRFEAISKRTREELFNVGTSSTTQKSVHGETDVCSSGFPKVNKMHLVQECINALQAIEGIDDAHMAKALNKVFENISWREFFLILPEPMRKALVLNM